jgi:hypothetical protein
MDATARGAEVSGLLNILRSFTEEKDVLASGLPFLVSVFTEIEREENPCPRPGRPIFSVLIDEFELFQVVHRLARQRLDHMKPKSFSVVEKRKVHEKRILKRGGKVNVQRRSAKITSEVAAAFCLTHNSVFRYIQLT